LLQKSKIEPRQKSRESRFLSIPIGARLLGTDTKVRNRSCVKLCGPSRREARDASAILKIKAQQPKNTFATKSANSRHPSIADIPDRSAPESVRICHQRAALLAAIIFGLARQSMGYNLPSAVTAPQHGALKRRAK
jgi:hypothetical protein